MRTVPTVGGETGAGTIGRETVSFLVESGDDWWGSLGAFPFIGSFPEAELIRSVGGDFYGQGAV